MFDIQNRTVADNLLSWMPVTDSICPSDGSYPKGNEPNSTDVRPFMHEALVASLVANGMSHPTNGIQVCSWENNGCHWSCYDGALMDRPVAVLDFHGSLPGFAYNLDGTPIKVALPILILYLLYTIPYVIFTLITGRSSRVWGSTSGFTALAVNSTPTEALKHTSAGIDKVETFRQIISVREVTTNEQLELVLEKEEGKGGAKKRIVVGRSY
jgi:hypothetical protein